MNRVRLLIKNINGDIYYIQNIDLENKKVYLGKKVVKTFSSSIFTVLVKAKISEYTYYINRWDYDERCRILTFNELSRDPEYIIGTLSLNYLYMAGYAGVEEVRDTDPIIPDFYRHIVPEKNYIYLSESNSEDIDCFGSTAVLRYDEFEEGKDTPIISYVVEQIRKASGAVKTKDSYYGRLKCRVWITRDGLDLTLGNTLEESRNGIGLLGLRLPYYLYPSLQEGESKEVDIYSYVTLQ
jgi:hypothetical protein